MMKSTLRLLVVAAGLAALPAQAADINNTGSDFGTQSAFGAPDTATYGQTFRVAPGDSRLTGFSMYLRRRPTVGGGSGPLMLRGYIASWDGAKADRLFYTSTVRSMNSDGTLQEFAFDTNVTVQPGFSYVAFLSVSEIGVQPRSRFGTPFGGTIPDGGFVFANNGLDFNSLFTTGWETIGSSDIWLKATFAEGPPTSEVPEPATWALMIGGLGLTGVAARRRRRARA